MLRLRGHCLAAQSVAFFSESMFRPKRVVDLTPTNVVSELEQVPAGSKLIRRWPDRALITGTRNEVIGIFDPLICLPLPVNGGVGGLSCEEYVRVLQEPGPGSMVLMLHREGMCCCILDKKCKPLVGPVEFLTRERGRNASINMHAAGSSAVFEDLFRFFQMNSAEIAACRTLWRCTTNQSEDLTGKLMSAERVHQVPNVVEMTDPRWTSGAKLMRQRLFSQRLMPDGEMASTLDPQLMVAACGHGQLQLIA